MNVLGLQEEIGVPDGNPRARNRNTQSPHIKVPANPETQTFPYKTFQSNLDASI